MKLVSRTTLAAATIFAAAAAPASAQAWKWDFGINGGYSWFTNMLDEEATGQPEGTVFSTAKFSSGILGGAQLTFWPGRGNLGIRANARYADRGVTGEAVDGNWVEHVNLWGGTLDLMYRFATPAEEFTGMEVLPYIAAGIGGKWHNPGRDQFTCVDGEENEEWSCAPFTAGTGATSRTFALGEQKVLAGLIGLGADWRLSRNFAIRTEISDQIFKPQIYLAERVGTTDTYNLPNGDENVSDLVHELGVQVGLNFLFGVPRPEVVAVTEPAPPPPPPAPTPAPPAEEAVTVCVIDPTVAGGIRMENAVFIPSSRDTMVTVNGQRMLLRNAVGNVMVASNADWYVQGQPLTMTVGKEKVQFVTTGTARMVEASELAFLGTIRGVPVYADKDDVADVIEEINELNRAQRGGDLEKMLEEHAELRNQLEDVEVVYLPLQPTGCVFQAVQRQEQVRKGGK